MSILKDIEYYKNTSLLHLLEVKEHYESLPLKKAIKKASTGMNPNGKMNSHQWRIGLKTGMKGAIELLKRYNEISNASSFEQIFEVTEKVKNLIFNLGDLWSYDTALRIGFNKGVYPKEVYVQAGVKKGVLKALPGFKVKQRSLSLDRFDSIYHLLEAYQLENFLCIWGKEGKRKFC